MDFSADFVFSPWQRRQGLAAVIERVQRYPIHHQRWRAIERQLLTELRHRAASTYGDPAKALKSAAQQAVFVHLNQPYRIAGDGYALDPHAVHQWDRQVRRAVNEAVVIDLLGADWRQSRHLKRG